ncbi:NifB/NifX family molybdenum-iron cluster-binding protein [candidate division KSB1 bacterium]
MPDHITMQCKKQTIVIPIHNRRISPVFDWCRKIHIVYLHSGSAEKKVNFEINCESDFERVDLLKNLGDCILLCGGISLQLENLIIYHGVKVISWISGNVEDILNCFLNESLEIEEHLMPGVCKKKHCMLRLYREQNN